MAYQRNMAKGETMRLYYSPDQPQLGKSVMLKANVMERSGEPLAKGDTIVTDGDRIVAVGTASASEVEACDIVEEGAPLGHRPAGHTGLGIVVLLCIPTVTGNFHDEVVAPQQRTPELLRAVNPPR